MVKSKVWIYSRRNMPMHRKKKKKKEKGREGRKEKGKERREKRKQGEEAAVLSLYMKIFLCITKRGP